ncbi:hypothetical protein SARC_15740, partial [Sphaeroforma arctica JP610]
LLTLFVLAHLTTVLAFLMWAGMRSVGRMSRVSWIGTGFMWFGVLYVTAFALASENKWVLFSAIMLYTFLSSSFPTTDQVRVLVCGLGHYVFNSVNYAALRVN